MGDPIRFWETVIAMHEEALAAPPPEPAEEWDEYAREGHQRGIKRAKRELARLNGICPECGRATKEENTDHD